MKTVLLMVLMLSGFAFGANEIALTWNANEPNVIADVFQPDGSVRETGISLTENGTGRMYIGSCATIQAGDTIVFRQNTTYIAGDAYRPSVNVLEIEGTDATDQVRDAVVDDSTRIDASQLNTHSAITAAGIVNEWESQSQTDPTGFHVNVLEVEGTDATNQIGDAVADEAYEDTYTLRQLVRLMSAVLFGKSDGGGTTSITFQDLGDDLTRVTATVNSVGNRSAVVLDPNE